MASNIHQFLTVREYTESLCKPLLLEDYHLQPIDDVSPPKWHLAHTSWFFETFILKAFHDYHCFKPQYDFLFNSYYETIGPRWQRAARGDLSRPPVSEIYAYRQAVNTAIQERYPHFSQRQLDLLELGIHHEQQHQELLLTDLKYSLGINPLFPALFKEPSPAPPTANPLLWHAIPSGVYTIGHQETSFCFDNEKGVHQVFINPCEIALQPVTQREYLEFMESGAYEHSRYWLSDGWDWLHQEKITAPLHWHQRDGKWFTFTLYGLVPLDLDAPVTHISYFEADAYARSQGARLPTEFEWEVAAQQCSPPHSQEPAHFLEGQQWQPVSHKGFFGNVWEWTSSAYAAYPGFEQAPGAVGEYNGKFMNGQYVLRGGSCVTPLSHMRTSYRNFFMPDKRWQFTGIRLARCLKESLC